MPGLVPAIHALVRSQGVDARHEAGHDGGELLHHHTALAACNAAMSFLLKPNSFSTSSVCSPIAGGGAAILLLVRDIRNGWPTTVSIDLSFFLTLCAMPRCLTCG